MKLFDVIAGGEQDGFYELRYVLRDGGMGQEFHRLQDRQRAEARAVELGSTTDVFVGAAPRFKRAGGAAAIRCVWALWVDMDTQKNQGRLAEFPHPPTLEIASGTPGNIHAWYALSHPLPNAWATIAIRRMVAHLGADPKVRDVARVMRPPGTLNWKHDPPGRVEVLGYRDVSYLASDLLGDIPSPPGRAWPVRTTTPRRFVDGDLERIPASEYIPALTGQEVDARGMARCVIHKNAPESNPSLKVYGLTFYCFGCADGGDVYQLGSRLWNMNRRTQFVELRKRLGEALGVRV